LFLNRLVVPLLHALTAPETSLRTCVKPLARLSGTEKYNTVPPVAVAAASEETKIPQVETVALNKPTSYNKSTSADDVTAALDRIQQKEARNQLRLKRITFIGRVLSVLMSAYMTGSMLYALIKYMNTKDKTLSDGSHPWSPDTVLWPTLMILATSGITFLMNTITLCFYLKSTDAADKSDTVMTYLGYAITLTHGIIWAINMGLFKMANTGNDLWGWSCGNVADEIQSEVKSYLNFNILCSIQSGTFYTGIVETITYLLTFLTYVYMAITFMHRRRARRLQQQMASQNY